MFDDHKTASITAVLIISAALTASYTTYNAMDQRINDLENQVQSIEDQEQTIYVNDTGVAFESIFDTVEQSIVYVNTDESHGSGFVYSENGYIVTNDHVIDGSERIDVTFTDGETKRAEIVGQDPYTDLAVLKVDRSGLTPLNITDSQEVRVGETAIAIGNPFGLESSMTQGIISQTGRSIQVEGGFSIRNVIQTDAAINPGNSGGPLMNRHGEVVGVNTAIETQTGGFSGIGFAVPSNTVERVVPDMIEEGRYEHAWIGVRGIDVNPDIAEAMELNETRGFLVLDLADEPGNPAEAAGLHPANETTEIDGEEIPTGGDIIVGINEEEMNGIEDILEFLELQANVGDEVTIEVIRNGERVELPLTLQPRP